MVDLPLHIRPFRAEDQAPARRLILEGLGEHWGWIDEKANPDLDDIASAYADGYFLIGWFGDALVATGALIPEDSSSMRIVRMSVAKTCRKRGFGREMLDHLTQIARSRGMAHVVLETTETWEGVIAFYRAYGFRVTGHADGDVHMVLDL